MPEEIKPGEMPTEQENEQPQPTLAEMTAELERAREALKSANSEAADRRRKLEAYEKAEEERKQAEMTELEKATKAKDEAEQKAAKALETANERLVRAEFKAEASKYQVLHPEDAFALADRSAVKVDDDGNVAGVAEAVKTLVEAGRLPLANGRPAAPNTDGGASGTRPDKSIALSAEEEEVARKMGIKPENYAKQKAK